MMNKDTIRKVMLNRRKKIPNKKMLSAVITDKIKCLPEYEKAQVVALYKGLINEVNIDELMKESLKKKIVLLPKIIHDQMVFITINEQTPYLKSNIGVLEPMGDVYYDNIDLIIVPGIAFDKNLNRLGFGKGYYDKFLSKKNAFKVGICFDNQVVDDLPINELDIPMDLVITDKRVLKKV